MSDLTVEELLKYSEIEKLSKEDNQTDFTKLSLQEILLKWINSKLSLTQISNFSTDFQDSQKLLEIVKLTTNFDETEQISDQKTTLEIAEIILKFLKEKLKLKIEEITAEEINNGNETQILKVITNLFLNYHNHSSQDKNNQNLDYSNDDNDDDDKILDIEFVDSNFEDDMIFFNKDNFQNLAQFTNESIKTVFEITKIKHKLLALLPRIKEIAKILALETLNSFPKINEIVTENDLNLSQKLVFQSVVQIWNHYFQSEPPNASKIHLISEISRLSNQIEIDIVFQIKEKIENYFLEYNEALYREKETNIKFVLDSLFNQLLMNYHFSSCLSSLVSQLLIHNSCFESQNEELLSSLKVLLMTKLENIVIGSIDYDFVSNVMIELFYRIAFSSQINKIKTIIAESKKEAFGLTLRSVLDEKSSLGLKELVAKLIYERNELIHTKTETEIQTENMDYYNFGEKVRRSEEIMGKYFNLNHLEYFVALLDPNNCRDLIDTLSQTLFDFIEQFGVTIDFIRMVISQQILMTKGPEYLFRANDVSTKLISKYAVLYGKDYLIKTLSPTIKSICKSGLNFEIDSYVERDPMALKQNTENIRKYYYEISKAIFDSAHEAPKGFYILCEHIKTEICQRFSDSKDFLTPIGGFIFLRFFCPAILLPQSFGILDEEPSDSASRGLLLLSSILQNVASGKTFGTNREYMQPFNDDISANLKNREMFFTKLSNAEHIEKESFHVNKRAGFQNDLNVELLFDPNQILDLDPYTLANDFFTGIQSHFPDFCNDFCSTLGVSRLSSLTKFTNQIEKNDTQKMLYIIQFIENVFLDAKNKLKPDDTSQNQQNDSNTRKPSYQNLGKKK
ncbi:ras gtpase-activating protein [Anaeramoeba ignava]|uniref:Ras gtpase-activating protein n=1 Tax=Anaeramoeba ignava TaxID=1746090 RepID=A0A9Q0R4T1_ANAIG|nr:ras gtpase-activating protein [Anaeramoeba ignava]